jgi:hypothetical protein
MRCSGVARRNRLATLGILLCLLAAVFAVEAKLAWYSPNTTARVELSASKLAGDDAPRLVGNVVSTPAPVPGLVPQALLSAAFVLAAISVFVVGVSPVPQKTWIHSGFIPPQFLRPPPRG